MDKSSVVNQFTNYVDQLRTQECSQKEKINCFQHIAECILSPAMASHINYATHCSNATSVLLLFCEDLDSVVRMSAEENLNRIFRSLERNRVKRILMDLYGEIKKNGNQRSLRICLNLFAYYAPRIKEKHISSYALRLLPCLQTIAQRKETQLCETLCEFIKAFAEHLQMGLNDSETCKLFDVFIGNIGSECAVKRRCSSQNCISLIENSRNRSLMAKHALNKAIDLLLGDDHQNTNILLGTLGFLRILLPLIIRDENRSAHVYRRSTSAQSSSGSSNHHKSDDNCIAPEAKQIIEIYDFCLHLLDTNHTSSHSIINASLEVINSILQSLDGTATTTTTTTTGTGISGAGRTLEHLLCNHQLQHNEYLRKRKSLKNQIFQLKNFQMTCDVRRPETAPSPSPLVTAEQRRCWMPAALRQPANLSNSGSGSGSLLSGAGDEESPGAVELNKHKMMVASTTTTTADALNASKEKSAKDESESIRDAFKLGIEKTRLSSSLEVPVQHPTPPPRKHHQHQYHPQPAARTTILTNAVRDKPVDLSSIDEVATGGCSSNDELQLKNHKDDQHHRRIIDDDDDDNDEDDGFTTLLEVNEPLQDDSHLSMSTASLPQADNEQTVEGSLSTTVTVDVNLLIEDDEVVEGGDSTPDGGGGPCDDKSQFLSDIDNESFNSIDFESEITIGCSSGGVGGGGGGVSAENDNNLESTSRAISTSSFTEGAASRRTLTTTAPTSIVSSMTTSVNSSCGSGKSTDTIGSFFNNLLSHSSAESMTKLFRSTAKAAPSLPASAVPDTTQVSAVVNPSVSPQHKSQQQQHGEDADNFSLESINSHVSLSSHVSLPTNSLGSRNEQDLVMVAQQSGGSSSGNGNDSIATASATAVNDDALSSASATATASTALLMDNTNTRNTSDVSDDDDGDGDKHYDDGEEEESFNVTKSQQNDEPEMDNSAGQAMQLNIGTIYDQAVIYYTSRFIVAKFLLTGQRGHLHSDTAVRVSIKHLSLNVIANCARLMPEVLRLSLEISAAEIRRTQLALQIPEEDEQLAPGHSSNNSSDSTSNSSNVGKDFDHLTDDYRLAGDFPQLDDTAAGNLLPLEIKDDHFGVSTTNAYLNQPLSRSVDPALLFAELGKHQPQRQPEKSAKTKNDYKRSEEILSKSEIIESKTSCGSNRGTKRPIVAARMADGAGQPITSQLRDVSIGGKCAVGKFNLANKQLSSSIPSSGNETVVGSSSGICLDYDTQQFEQNLSPHRQTLSDVLLFYSHSDPILRGDVQIIIGNFMQSTLGLYHNRNELFANGVAIAGKVAGDYVGNGEPLSAARSSLEINRLLAILIKGLQDDIHTVVIHALNAFDKIFPLLMSKYLTASYKHQQQQHSYPYHYSTPDATNDDDEKDPKASNASSCYHYDEHSLYADDDTLIGNLLKCFESSNKPGQQGQPNDTLPPSLTIVTTTAVPLLTNEQLNCTSNAGYCPSFTSDHQGLPQPPNNHHHRLKAREFFIISPKLLLSKLRLCYHNKYWLVLNKYSEVISNLDYDAIREYYGNDMASTYEDTFLDELVQLVGDDDFRVREHAADCLCRFIIQISGHRERRYQASKQMPSGGRHDSATMSSSSSNELDRTNFNLLWDFYDSRIFQTMSMPIRDLFAEQSPAERLANGEVLAKVLYRLTNKLMELNDRNLQFGIIYAVKVLLKAFNFFDFREVWMEFNFAEICLKFAYYNYATALDLNCQSDLMEATATLIAGNGLTTNVIGHNRFVDNLLTHTMKIINIYYHLFTNQKPLLFAKVQRNDLFANAKELAIVNSTGYFGNDHVYIKLYSILKSANDSYKMTINQISGAKLISLLRTCINTLSTCIELRMNCGDPSSSGNPIKLIEEIIQYLSKLINYAPTECIGSLRQLLKFLFRRNYGSRRSDYQRFISPYLVAKSAIVVRSGGDSAMTIATGGSPKHLTAPTSTLDSVVGVVSDGASTNSSVTFGQLFSNGLEFPLCKSDWENDCARHIKLFEPLVIYCLTMFMKSNARVQASILELLSLLLELNVTYSILDSKGMIFEEIMNNLELIESGVARNGSIIIPPVLKFLVQLTYKSDRKVITVPKIISIANNLLANNSIRECSVLALKGLAFEIFFMPASVSGTMHIAPHHHRPAPTPPPSPGVATVATSSPIRRNMDDTNTTNALDAKELDTQKEVILGMLEKFIDSQECQRMLAILLLRDRSWRSVDGGEERHQQAPTTNSPMQDGAIYSIVTKALCDGRIRVYDWQGFFVLESLFRNSGKNILLDSKEFSSMLALFISKDVESFSDLSCATIILENVILKTEEIYLVNHIKLYLKNHSDTGMGIDADMATPIDGSADEAVGGLRGPESSGYHHLQSMSSSSSATDYTVGRRYTNLSNYPSTSRVATTCAPSTTFGPHSNARSTSTGINEINYFAKVLCEKLDGCLATLTKYRTPPNRKYCGLVVRFIRALYAITEMKDLLQPAVRHILVDEYNFWDRYNLGGLSVDEGLQMEMLKLFVTIKLSSDRTGALQQIQADGIKWNVQRTLFREICLRLEHDLPTENSWSYREIQQLFSRSLLNVLINDNLSTVRLLCDGNEEFCSLFLRTVIENCDALEKSAIRRLVVQFIGRLENHRMHCIDAKVELLTSLFDLVDAYGNKSLENLIVRTSRRIIAEHHDKSAVRNNFLISCSVKLKKMLFGEELSAEMDEAISRRSEQKIIDEKWLFAQITNLMRVEFSTSNAEKLSRILLEVTSEYKLTKIFTSPDFDARNLFTSTIDIALKSMLSSFRNNCIQHNPHIHYMNVNPLARVAISTLMTRIDDYQTPSGSGKRQTPDSPRHLASAMIALMENLKCIEEIALIYIESKFIDKFVKEHLLRPELMATLKKCLQICSSEIELSLINSGSKARAHEMHTYSHCIDVMLKHKLIWSELNLSSDDNDKESLHSVQLLNDILNMLFAVITQSMGNTIFYKKYKSQLLAPSPHTMPVFQKAIFIAKLIETSSDVDDSLRVGRIRSSAMPMRILKSIGISILRINRFYAYAVSPLEIYHQSGVASAGNGGSFGAASGYESQIKSSNGKLPSIPVEHLSDVDVLQKFVKRLSIFGFTTRQQFEEYFMTFLLLINEVYDENMVDVQEQFQIKSVCLEAILELLITYKTFPIVGSKVSYFHHTTRWSRINCDSISLKKLHKVQLLVSDSNIFYHPNLERNLSAADGLLADGIRHNVKDNVIGTLYFQPNQYDLNFIWQQMEAYNNPNSPSRRSSSSSSGAGDATPTSGSGTGISGLTTTAGKEDVFTRNFRHFTENSGIDFRSSSQFIFDVLMQINEHNHILALPNLVKFCEICDSRDQIKLIRDKALRLQETIPMDDTITHQYVIYLLCKTQAMLIPTPNELSHLCTLAGVYLKSSHVFIRNATLSGLLCLLECCSKTNTTIGKLSEELSMLRDLVVGYINRHGVIEESTSLQCQSDTHMKLVWTLNFSLIEWTAKFVTQCHLLSNTIIWANKFLKRTTNEDIYLCVIHGLERIIVIKAATPEMRGKIEKLALDLMKLENERFSIPALKLLLSCMYMSSSKQLENTELSNGIVQDDPEIIAQQTDKVDILLHCIKSSTRNAAWIYGQVLCQIIRDLVPPNEILTKVIKEFLAINQPHCDVIASIVHQVFRSAIDSSFLQMLQDWLICSLPTFLTLPQQKGVWALTVIFLSASINLHLIKLFPVVLVEFNELGQQEITLFQASAQDFHSKLSGEQKTRFREAFKRFQQNEIYAKMLNSL